MFKWQLINDSITKEDKLALIDHISVENVRFTQKPTFYVTENSKSAKCTKPYEFLVHFAIL